MLTENTSAPLFTLKDQNGKDHSLEDARGKWLLLYFYPRDNTPGCTKEACEVRDNFDDFSQYNCLVWGVSTDSVESHKKFEEKHGLPFTLLADTEKEVVLKYDVWAPKKFMGKEFMGIVRASYLINPEGKITKVYPKVKPALHALEVLEDLRSLTN